MNTGYRNESKLWSLDECQGYRQAAPQMPITFAFPFAKRTGRFYTFKPLHLYGAAEFLERRVLLVYCFCLIILTAH